VRDDHQRILIIDDEPVVLDSCADILEGEPYEVTTAIDGAGGLALLEEIQPDLVFVDLKMPGISGIEVLKEINERDPTVVTVVITGYATVTSAVEAMKRGAYDFIPKPFTPDQFRLVTRRGIEKRRLTLETITLRRERETLRENFAAIVSHELKSPLNAVQQNLFVLSRQLADTATEAQMGKLQRMESRIADLIETVDTWLHGISFDLDAIRDRFGVLPVSMPIAKAVERVEPHAIRKDVSLIVSIGEPAPTVFGDEGTLIEALANLIDNGVKYSYEAGTVTITAKACHGHTRIDVSDTGIGIPGEDLPLVFGDFYRGKATTDGTEGVGLGLALTRRIIEAHNGTISVESEVGKGSIFTIILPAEPLEAPPASRPDSAGIETASQENTNEREQTTADHRR
jgi:signal transduction histidine kinase